MSCIGRVASGVVVGCVLVFGGAAGGFGQVEEGDIVITEIMYNPDQVSDARGEWFEIYNTTDNDVDINGWSIEEADGSPSRTINNGGALNIPKKSYAVLGRNDDTSLNGDVTLVYEYGSWTLNQGGDSIVLKSGMTEVDRVVYDTTSFPVATGASISLKGDAANFTATLNDTGANWCLETEGFGDGDKGTPGEASDCGSIPDPITGAIYVIQGSGATSSQARGMATTNNNIVTALAADGFFIQTPTASSDNDVDTSDGIFVLYDGSLTINVGDQVDVVGRVDEHFGFTLINATTSVTDAEVTFDNPNQPLPAPVEFNATVPSPNPASPSCAIEFECYEGMRIRIATGTVSSPSQRFGGDPLAEMYITPTSLRAFREKGVKHPGLTSQLAIPVWDGNPERFELDPDRLGLDNVSWVPGTMFSATGVLGYEFGGYEIWPAELSGLNLVPSLPHAVRPRRAGEVTVASVNMLQLNDGSLTYGTKRNKLALYIRNVLRSPDVIGVQEVETIAALRGLADEIRRGDSTVRYTPYLEVGNRVPGINVGFLVRSGVTVGSVTQLNKEETYVDPSDNMTVHLHDRPPLRLDAAVQGIEFSVIVVHNRSLIKIDHASDGERVRKKRLEQAQSVARLAQSLQDKKLLIVGDFNGYQFTDGYVDVIGQITGNVTPSENLVSGLDLVDPNLINLIERVPAAQRYSYYFDNNAQLLDHALVNEEMAGSVVDIQYARGNVDARAAHRSDPDTPLGASDHDGFVVYLSAPGRPAPGGGGSPGGGGGGVEAQADLSLDVESRIVSGGVVRFSVSVDNAGPDTARNVVVGSSLRGVASIQASTSGCEEDPDGVSTCTLGDIAAEDSASFRIDVDTGIAGEASVRYTGSAGSDTKDPRPDDDEIGIVQPLGPPNAPSDLVATAISSTEIELQWRDNSNAETAFAVFQQGPGDSRLRVIGTVPANTTSTVVEELVPDTTYRFAVEARNDSLSSRRTPKSTATTWFSDAARCSQDDVLCLGNFEVEVEWDDGKGKVGRGMAERLTAESGDFWFFDPANIELVIKVLDGCQANGHYWVFAAGLTDVEVTTTVRDLKSGLEMSWTNPQGTLFEPIGDTSAFATCGEAPSSSGASRIVLSGAPKGRAAELYRSSLTQADRVAAASSACVASDTALCLQNSRYEVQANWQTGERSGAATVIPRTADTGMFWFFSQGNVELIVKVLDGCALNGHRWVLMGGLTDVGVEIMVTDSESGEAKMYGSPGGSPFATMFDVTAFSCSAGQ